MPSFTNKVSSILFAVLGCFILWQQDAIADSKVEIRFAAAVASYRQSLESNQPLDHSIETAGYDVLWRGVIKNNYFTLTESKVLSGTGTTKNVYKIGGGTCTGTLSVNSESSSVPLGVVFNGANRGQISIQLPHIVANTTLNAFLMDKNQPEQSTCRTAGMQLASATCFNPTRDCFTIGGNISPLVPHPSDNSEFAKFFIRKDIAWASFNPDSPNASIPFSYIANNTIISHLGETTDIYKAVWAGYLTISSSPTTGTPPGIDPFSLLNIDPNTLTGPPADITTPTNPFVPPPPPGNDFDVRELNSWLKNIKDSVKSFTKALQGLIGARSLLTPTTGITFDDVTGIVTISAEAIGYAPGTGKVQMKFKALKPDKAEGYVLTIPKKAPSTDVAKGSADDLQFTIPAASLRLIKSGKSAKVFFLVRFTPPSGKKTYEKKLSFKLAALKAN